MESLTQMVGENAVPVEFDCDFVLELDDKTYKGLQKIFNRLASIERVLGKNYDLDRLRELIQADRDGRCVVLPQKKVFEIISEPGMYCDLICPIKIDGVSQCDCCEHGIEVVKECDCKQEHLDRIGKTVFLTREQAEFVLNEMKEAGME